MQFYFTVHGPSSHLFGKDGLKVCFEKEDEASRWREAFRDAISHLSTDLIGRHLSADLVARSPSTFQESPLGRDRTNSVSNMTPVSSPGSEAFMDHSNLAKVRHGAMPYAADSCLAESGNATTQCQIIAIHCSVYFCFKSFLLGPSSIKAAGSVLPRLHLIGRLAVPYNALPQTLMCCCLAQSLGPAELAYMTDMHAYAVNGCHQRSDCSQQLSRVTPNG